MQMAFHLLSVSSSGFARRRSAVLGGNQRLNAQLVAGQLVVGFAVETGVRRDGLHTGAGPRFDEQRAKVAEVGSWPLAGPGRQAEVAQRVADHTQLGIVAIDDGGLASMFPHLFSPPSIIAADVPRLEAAGVHRGQSHTAAEDIRPSCPLDRSRDQPSKRLLHQQPIGRLLQRREVGHLFQADRCGQRIAVRQQPDRAPIGEVVKVLQHQTRKQLRLRELLGAEPMRIRGQRSFRHRQRFAQHPFRTLAGLHSFRYDEPR